MPPVLEILFFLGIALLIITLVGHGIWVFLAFIFGGGQKKHKRRSCVFCGRTISVNDDFCQWCMRDLTSPLAAEMADIDAVLRQLKRFERQGTLQVEMVANLTERVSSYREQLLHPQSAVAATVVPEPVTPKPVAAEIPPTPRAAAAIEKPHAKVARPIEQAAIDSANPQVAAIVPPMEITAKPARPPRASIAAAGSAKILGGNSGRIFGRAQHPLDGIDRGFIGRAADGRFFNRAGDRFLEPVGKHSRLAVPDICRFYLGRIRRRIIRLSPLETGIDRPGA